MKSPPRAIWGIGAGVAAAAVGAGLGLAAERWSASRANGDPPDYGSVRGYPQAVVADDGVRLHVEVDEADPGVAAPVTVIFSHGFCLSHDIWHFQRRALRGQHRLVLWDQRGHGRSATGPADHYTLEQCGRDLGEVIAAVAPTGPIVLVGHSMGGMTVMELAASQPELIRRRVVGVAFVATTPGGLADESWGFLDPVGRLAHRFAPGTLSQLARAPSLVQRTRRLGREVEQLLVKRYSYASPVSPELVRFSAGLITATPIEVVAGFWPHFDRHDRVEALAVLADTDTLVFSGDRDLVTPPEHSARITSAIRGARQVVVPQAGHMVMLEHPEALNDSLQELLTRVALSTPRAPRRWWTRG